MLILTRRLFEIIRLGDDIEIVLLGVKGKQARLGIKAPQEIPIYRQEIYEQIEEGRIMNAGQRQLEFYN